RLIWTPAALHDIARLHAFLVEKNPEAAARAIKIIRRGVKLLIRHPEAGRPDENHLSEFREWPIGFGHGGYVVLYHFDGQQVTILAVKHGKELGY
ncbi:MAG: type II toxin-antitoxin system RelE/ParE family toxin, partial [Gammaproteobacteria bacterium]